MTEGHALHENYRDEIESALKIDTQRLGDVFKERETKMAIMMFQGSLKRWG